MDEKVKEASNYHFSDLVVGQKAETVIRIDKKSIDQFADCSGDYSPIHSSLEFAHERGHENHVGHGLLLGAFVSQLIGMKLPGKFGMLQSVNLKFHKTYYAGDEIVINGTIKDIVEVVKTIIIDIKIHRGNDLICSGTVQSGVSE